MSGCFSVKKNQPNESSITIAFAGDTMLGRVVNETIKQKGYAYPWGNTLPLLNTADLRIINLETTFTKSSKKEPKVFNFKSASDNVQSLVLANINVVSLANNHTKDFGNEGLIETIETLDRAGILHVGAGHTIHQAKQPIILQKNNVSIGIIGVTDNEPTWKATDTQPGTNYFSVQKPEQLIQDIAQLKQQVDIVIVSIHWGPNMQQRPTQQYIDTAHKIIDAGADIIHGHSAHIFQGIELYKNKLIMYDTGDFVDDYRVDPVLRNDQAILFFVTINKTGVKKIKLTPLLINNMQVNLATQSEKKIILDKIKILSQELETSVSNDGTITVSP